GVQAFPNQLTFSPPSLANEVPDEVKNPRPVPAVTVPNGLAGLAIPGGGR
ncbi:mammalian cell entry protein, partial [Acinetobacter baumannii]|nr:mammalian cell entry protein [Acinetobacter baumannii]